MPVIPEMDEFVNWDKADPAVGTDVDTVFANDLNHDPDLDLALANVDGDDFSFWALQHYGNSNLPTLNPSEGAAENQVPAFADSFEIPDAPCSHCQQVGNHCKRINEGQYRGYCTSCVALRRECSFGLASAEPGLSASGSAPGSASFPFNPWPVVGVNPGAVLQEDIRPELLQEKPGLDLPSSISPDPAENAAPSTTAAPKIGARFSRESVRILKNWLSTHNRHPYPTEEEKEMLQKQTNLNKTQISNWLANARRRGKIVAPRSTSPGVRQWSNPIDIPQRKSLENMNPLQRWQNSPPENEPASVTAIARAVTASSTMSSGLDSPFSLNFTDDGSGRSLCAASSSSSVNTSRSSGGSFASAYSHGSRGSFGSYGSHNRGRRRRRRKAAAKRPEEPTSLAQPLKTFQCTFCTETFRTKHDWQRHEKSLHLSLERWVCAPNGPRNLNPENSQVSCVFCGEANPNDAHIESHNHSACQERSLEERTFYRKDHLRQHLKLVHGVKFVNWSMEPWRVSTPQIRSRCGFCNLIMDTWTIRVDHLAEHFKTGYSMADWQGDWGFEAPVLEMVENSIPPYLIHDERNSPNPYHATGTSPETPASAYELLKSELVFYLINTKDSTGKIPNDEELQIEACRIIFGAEVLSTKGISSTPSWLRDLLTSSEKVTQRAKMAPIRSQNDSRMAYLRINGKDNIFEDDVLERQLHDYVKARRLLGLTAMDGELQVEACNILGRLEESSSTPSDEVANFLLRLIFGSTKWLAAFRQRAALPRSEDLIDENLRSKDKNTVDSTIHNFGRLEAELAEYVATQRLLGSEPDDAALQRQARVIIYEFDDGWNQTAADNSEWLNAFKSRHGYSTGTNTVAPNSDSSESFAQLYSFNRLRSAALGDSSPTTSGHTPGSNSLASKPGVAKHGKFFLNDANCYRRLARELGRWAASTMSPNNPNCHIPSDEELQHQARWILYDDDDPWNQTAADNAEWLRRFKVDAGILTDPSLPGFPDGKEWRLSKGGTGFAPPYVMPSAENAANMVPVLGTPADEKASNPQPFAVPCVLPDTATADEYLRSIVASGGVAPRPVVFCSPELESGLDAYVTSAIAADGVAFPSDEALQVKAREIVGLAKTPAEDPVLLDKFKEMMRGKLGLDGSLESLSTGANLLISDAPLSASTIAATAAAAETLPALPLDMDMTGITDGQLTDILQDMDFEFGDGTDLSDPILGGSLGTI